MKGIARVIQRRMKRVGVWDQVIAERDGRNLLFFFYFFFQISECLETEQFNARTLESSKARCNSVSIASRTVSVGISLQLLE